MKTKIAITGANGFIGSYLTQFLTQQNFTVRQMGRTLSPAPQPDFIPFTLGKQFTADALAGCDALVHCAYDFSALGYTAIRKVNVEGTLELFSQARDKGIKKIIYISSTSAFKEAVSDYGKAKFEIEQRAAPFGVIIIRPGLVFDKHNGGIIRALEKFVKKFPLVPIIGKGQQEFYPCHVEDLATLITTILASNIKNNNPIVAASEEKITFKQLMLTLAELHGRSVLPIPVPYEFLFTGLKLAEALRLKTGLRSDSLKYMKFSNKEMDFSATRALNIYFRPFSVATLQT
jgi:nucleoside-diphosphate-sugar epimerase